MKKCLGNGKVFSLGLLRKTTVLLVKVQALKIYQGFKPCTTSENFSMLVGKSWDFGMIHCLYDTHRARTREKASSIVSVVHKKDKITARVEHM